MRGRTETKTTSFRVIEGGLRPGIAPPPSLRTPDAPRLAPAELAAEMAELYALSLVRDMPFSKLQDPHHVIRVDGATRFTLHELLCELRSLSWFEQRMPLSGLPEEVLVRRAQRVNRDGQLTLRSLFQGTGSATGLGFSAFHMTDRLPARAPEPCAPPELAASMSCWLDWLQRCSGAGLALPGFETAGIGRVETPRALMLRLQTGTPCRVYFNAALLLLARGTEFDPGLGGVRMTGQQILSLMAETVRRATDLAMQLQIRADRLSRPGVTAARLAALAGRDELPPGEISAVAEELATNAPGLLHWVSRANRAAGRIGRGREMLLLPPLDASEAMPHRADCAAQVIVAGALSTLLKALFDTGREARLQMVERDAAGINIAAEADRLAADIALARSVSGGWYQCENMQELRIGEALALQVLRGHLTRHERSVALGLRDFDGRMLCITAQPGALGPGAATLRIDGRLASWPLERRREAHLAVI